MDLSLINDREALRRIYEYYEGKKKSTEAIENKENSEQINSEPSEIEIIIEMTIKLPKVNLAKGKSTSG